MTELRTIKKSPVCAVALIGATIGTVPSFIYRVILVIFILMRAANLNALLQAGASV
ncbi:MAG: hypothetical protein ABSD89_06310 [Halobacteriota archaeon]